MSAKRCGVCVGTGKVAIVGHPLEMQFDCPRCTGPGKAADEAMNEEAMLLEILTGSPALAKACLDYFDYALKLRTGEVIYFWSAKVLNKEWVHLELKPEGEQPEENRIAYPGDRGVDVRLSDIVWVMDAPMGS